ncbi:MAG: hypothetical protein L6Q97_21850, partial [Thermoanaerobaculia bacterium]|nr:hypothetical protein [Thermoanaerobaculia bacterium]
MVKVCPPPPAVNVTLVLPDTVSRPIVCDGTPVMVNVPPRLITKISLAAGVVRVGVQLVEVAQLP